MIEYTKYDRNFFSELEENSYRSALVVVPIIAEFFSPKSVIDVGCGTGAWLKAWAETGALENYLGIDGPYVNTDTLLIPVDKFRFEDLKEPVRLDQKFDIAMCLEVGEHLPDAKAAVLVQSLVSLSDVVIFSAALPGQMGTYHINEQYPEYWAGHFKKFGFLPVDFIRTKVWDDPRVEYWYQQNIIVFIREEKIKDYPSLRCYAEVTNPRFLTRIHPYLFELKKEHIKRTKTAWGFANWKWYLFKQKYIKRNAKQ